VFGCYESDNEPCGSMKCGEFIDQLIDYKLLKKNPIILNSVNEL
jgi:hypothetical protein